MPEHETFTAEDVEAMLAEQASKIARRTGALLPSNVFTFLDLSTAHVSPTSRLWLEGQALAGAVERGPSHTVAAYAEGWWVWVPQDFGDEEPLKQYRDRIPADLNAPLMLAHKLGCYYVRFDADGDVDDSLPVVRDDETSLDGFPPEARAAIEAARANPEDAGIADELAEPGELDAPYPHEKPTGSGIVVPATPMEHIVVSTARLGALIDAAKAVIDEPKDDGAVDGWTALAMRLETLRAAIDDVF